MLVLSRKLYEEIRIGKDIVIRITAVGNDRVSIGVTAPKETPVIRGELVRVPKEVKP